MLGIGFWAASASGGGGGAAFELISTNVLGSSTASVTFSLTAGQQATYKHLQIRMAGGAAGSVDAIKIRLGGASADTGNNYVSHFLLGNGSISSGQYSGFSNGIYPGNIGTSATATPLIMDILDPFSTSKYKTTRALSGYYDGSIQLRETSGLWMSTTAVGTINFTLSGGGSFASGSRFSVYGLRGA